MARATYDEALRRLLAHEGGYSNHPSDPGGPTNFGITLADYRRYIHADAAAADVRAMTVDQAKAIYRAHYWDALSCDGLPAGVDYAVFDYGVNSGVARAGKVLRRLLGLSATGGAVTPAVVAAAALCDRQRLVAAICDERLAFLRGLSTWRVFGAGWSRRVAEVKAAALAMAGAPATSAAAGEGASSTNARPHRPAIVAALVAAAATAAAQLTDALRTPWGVAAIVVAAAALAGGAWLAWRLWRRRTSSTRTGAKT